MGEDTFGASLRRLRNVRGLSLRQLSGLAHLDYGYLSKIENDLRPPTDTVAHAVDIALDCGGDLIAIAQIQRATQGRQAVAFDPVRRREFVAAGIATAVASLSGVRDSTKRIGQVGINDADRLQRAVARLRSLGHQHGGANLWQAAEGLAREGYHLLEQGRYTEQVGDLLLIATGRAQMCAGWLAFDSGQHVPGPVTTKPSHLPGKPAVPALRCTRWPTSPTRAAFSACHVKRCASPKRPNRWPRAMIHVGR